MANLSVRDYALGCQHLLAMFGATVLVPLITGFSPAAALFSAGVGTLLFHLCTKGKVPVFLGSSFAFIGALCTVVAGNAANIPKAQGGIITAGLIYLFFALIAYFLGPDRIRKFFPPLVTGPVIIIIGLSLTGVGVSDAFGKFENGTFSRTNLVNALIALFTFVTIVVGMNRAKGIFRLIPILIGITGGYLLCVILSCCGLYHMDFHAIVTAPWFNIPYKTEGFLTFPSFDLSAIILIAPIALVTFMEHLGDITTNGAVVGKDFFKDPGLHRTLTGDGLATIAAGFLGGPANTTYAENTGVLASTGNYNPATLRIAAVMAIVLGLIGKFGAVLLSIPAPVKGGVELMLFGMIASIGIRTISEAKINLAESRNLSIMAGTLCVGVGLNAIGGIPLVFGEAKFTVSALFVATIVGVVMNLLIPEKKEK